MDKRQKRYSFSNFEQNSIQSSLYQDRLNNYHNQNEHPKFGSKCSHLDSLDSSAFIGHRNNFVQLPSFGDSITPSVFKRSSNEYNQYKQRQPMWGQEAKISVKDKQIEGRYRRQNIQIDSISCKSWNKPIREQMRSSKLQDISDMRIVNIDKINIKIKNILDKLNEEQSKNNTFAEKVDKFYEENNKRQKSIFDSRKNSYFNSSKFSQHLYGDHASETQQSKLIDIMSSGNGKQRSTIKQHELNESGCRSIKYNRFIFTPSNSMSKDKFDAKKYTEMYSPSSDYQIKNQRFSRKNDTQIVQKNNLSEQKQFRNTFNPNKYQGEQLNKSIDEFKGNCSNKFQAPIYKNPSIYGSQFSKPKKTTVWSSDKSKINADIIQKSANKSLIYNRSHLYEENQPRKSDLFERKSVSKQKSIILKNGKNLDNQIERIQYKMNQLAKIKEELNLKENSSTQAKNSNLSTLKTTPFQINNTIYKDEKQIQLQKQVLKSSDTNKCKNRSSREKEVSIQYDRKQHNKKANQQVALPKPFQMAKNKQTKRMDSLDTLENLRGFEQRVNQTNRTNEQNYFIPCHIPLPQSSDEPRNYVKSINKLIMALTNQIYLDSQFRNAKKWFQNNCSIDKWTELQQYQKLKKSFNLQQLKSIFTLQQDQNNPFYSVRQTDYSIKQLIDLYQKTQKHWNNNIFGKFNQQNLINEGFTMKNIDLDKKGTITVQDFLRFINFEANTFYRIRDVALVFKRITSSFEVSFEKLLSILCESMSNENYHFRFSCNS